MALFVGAVSLATFNAVQDPLPLCCSLFDWIPNISFHIKNDKCTVMIGNSLYILTSAFDSFRVSQHLFHETPFSLFVPPSASQAYISWLWKVPKVAFLSLVAFFTKKPLFQTKNRVYRKKKRFLLLVRKKEFSACASALGYQCPGHVAPAKHQGSRRKKLRL